MFLKNLKAWGKAHPTSYKRACDLGIQREVARLAGMEILTSYEEWHDILVVLKERPNQNTKEGRALHHIQQKRPDLYEKLLEENPNLKPRDKVAYEEWHDILVVLKERPNQKLLKKVWRYIVFNKINPTFMRNFSKKTLT